jgi:beta-galactosidase
MYMVHGGSNFGFTAGANALKSVMDYQAHITSYDYDAPIN